MSAFVYILASRRNGTLYTGVTSGLPKRMAEHRSGVGSVFTQRYAVKRLVYIEPHAHIEQAIVREKRIKRWRRTWKIALIEDANPNWDDLFFTLNR